MTPRPVDASRLVGLTDAAAIAEFATDVRYYLMQSPRQLPSRYLYDPLGSALFEAICQLPWYRITRAEERLLRRHGAEILRTLAPVSTIIELGSGNGGKLRILAESDTVLARALDIHLVDISSSALEASARTLESIDAARVTTHQEEYEAGLFAVTESLRDTDRVLVLFLGSNIGNFDPPGAEAFVRSIRSRLRPGDAVLLGADLVKPPSELLLAYDDPLGVTAAFNRNLLVRINRELGGDFDVDRFAHEALWNEPESRIEMHLRATRAQTVHVRAADLAFTIAGGDRIWTESSYKYRPAGIARLLETAGFRLVSQWLDRMDQFALTLVEAV